jgi:hypothetical protein
VKHHPGLACSLAAIGMATPTFAYGYFHALTPVPLSADPLPLAPIRAREVMQIQGRLVPTSPWFEIAGPGDQDPRASAVYAYDTYDSGSSTPGGAPNGPRFSLPLYAAPQVLEDLTIAPGTGGLKAQFLDTIIVVSGHCPFAPAPSPLYATYLSFEEDASNGCVVNPPFIVGLQVDLGTVPEGEYLVNLNLSATTIGVPMPSDGLGGLLIGFTTDPLGLDLACVQTALWCTGDQELPAELRAGSTAKTALIDDTQWAVPPCSGSTTPLPSGTFDFPCECYDLLAKWGPSPFYQSAAPTIGLGVIVTSACVADCDASGSLDINDFICFQTLFSIGELAADCDGTGGLDINDFICFQTLFSLGC